MLWAPYQRADEYDGRELSVLATWPFGLVKLSSLDVDQADAATLEEAEFDDTEPPEVRPARKVAQKAQTNFDRYPDTIEKGMDAGPNVERSRAAQAELSAAKAAVEDNRVSADFTLGEDQLREVLCLVRGITGAPPRRLSR